MQPVATRPATTPIAPAAAAEPAGTAPAVAGGGLQGLIGDALRSGAAGYQAVARQSAVQADKAAIHPFEAVTTATGLLKEKTSGLKGVNRATGILHTVGGFAMLILTANVSAGLRSPGETAVDVANRVADAIDGRDTAQGWSLGWGIRTPGDDDGTEDGGEQPNPAFSVSPLGAALAASGMQ